MRFFLHIISMKFFMLSYLQTSGKDSDSFFENTKTHVRGKNNSKW